MERKFKYLAEGWERQLIPTLTSESYQNLLSFLKQRETDGVKVYPQKGLIFRALKAIDLHQVKVVILGQTPYDGPGQANGYAFAVNPNLPAPPTLRNIFAEVEANYRAVGEKVRLRGTTLDGWVKQGVLLLNSCLTAEEGLANAHVGKGWEQFTDAVIKLLSDSHEGLVFMLWGKFAQSKDKLINPYKHKILRAAHPAPLSANNGFFGCGHFIEANNFLIQTGKTPIDWQHVDKIKIKKQSFVDALGV